MEIEYPKGQNLSSMNQNPIKYTYHSSQPQAHCQPYSHSQIQNDQPISSNPYRLNQPNYQFNHSSSNVSQGNPQTHGYNNNQNGYSAHSSHNIGHTGGYQFSQYHMNNNYTPQYSHHDEQLLEDLPGDENMQRLFWDLLLWWLKWASLINCAFWLELHWYKLI